MEQQNQSNRISQIANGVDEKASEKQIIEIVNHEIQEMQNFLKQQIMIAGGYNQLTNHKFAAFYERYLRQEKGIQQPEQDLKYVELKELKQIVERFKTMHQSVIFTQPEQNQDIIIPQNQSQPQKSFIKQKSLMVEKSLMGEQSLIGEKSFKGKKIYYTNGAWDYQIVSFDSCLKTSPFYQLHKKQSEINIIFTKNELRRSGGFLGLIGSKQELWITIKTKFQNFTVDRKVDDFLFLKKILTHKFPGTFILPLDINPKDLQNIADTNIKSTVLKECKLFLTNLCKQPNLFQNVYTWRFFTEKMYDNYIDHKQKNQTISIKSLKQLQNLDGTLSIQISKKNEKMKSDYGKKSDIFCPFWKNISKSSLAIEKKLEEIQLELAKINKDLSIVVEQLNTEDYYQHMTNVLICFNELFTVSQLNLQNYKKNFQNLRQKIAVQSEKNWRQFIIYKNNFLKTSQEYQQKRKTFISDQAKEASVKGFKKVKQSQKEHLEQSYMAESIVKKNEAENNKRQQAWIEKYSKWQAYLNKEFINCFEALLLKDIQSLKIIMKESAQRVLEIGARDDKSLISFIESVN